MYSKGHIGLTLLILSLLMIPFRYSETAIVIILFSAMLSSLPDIDLSLQRFSSRLHHRGPTHSILFAAMVGISFGLLLYYSHQTLGWFGIGFLSGFMGVVSHLIGDMLTYHAFKPLWPLSDREVALGLCPAGSRTVNEGLMTLGAAAFLLYLLQTTGALSGLI